MAYKGILLDLDNTLYSYEEPHAQGMQAVLSKVAPCINSRDFQLMFEAARQDIHQRLQDTAASHNRLLYFQRTLELLQINDITLPSVLNDIYWETFLSHMHLYDGVIDFLTAHQHQKIAIVTDLTAAVQFKKLIRLNLAPYIDAVVTSEEVGVEKPNRKIFETACSKLGLTFHEVCMIGDCYEKDIEGSLALGIGAYWKTQQKSDTPHVITFDNFSELKGVLA